MRACTRVLQTLRPKVDRSAYLNFQHCRKSIFRISFTKRSLEVDCYKSTEDLLHDNFYIQAIKQ